MRVVGLQSPAFPGLYNVFIQAPKQNTFGFYGNQSFDFGVVRWDCAYKPDRKYNSADLVNHPQAVSENSWLGAQIAWSTSMMIESINRYQAFSISVELIGEFVFDADSDKLYLPTYFTEIPEQIFTLMSSVSTNYDFGKWSPSITLILTSEENGLFIPSITYAPDWMNSKWSFKLAYSNIFGPEHSYPFGLMKEKDNVYLQTQFSFP